MTVIDSKGSDVHAFTALTWRCSYNSKAWNALMQMLANSKMIKWTSTKFSLNWVQFDDEQRSISEGSLCLFIHCLLHCTCLACLFWVWWYYIVPWLSGNREHLQAKYIVLAACADRGWICSHAQDWWRSEGCYKLAHTQSCSHEDLQTAGCNNFCIFQKICEELGLCSQICHQKP